jgi:hypothetical protein
VIPEAGRGVLLAAGLAAVAIGLPHAAFVDGHLAQLVIPLLWLLAAREAREGRGATAGALVGVSAGFELWGVLGVVVLALVPRLRTAAVGLAVEAGIVLLVFVPFVVAGDFRMFSYSWRIADGTLASLVLSPGDPFPWELRIAQGAVVVAIGVTLAYVLRRSRHAAWIALGAAVSARLALDPVFYSWYWLALQTLVLVGAVQLACSGAFRAFVSAHFGKRSAVPIEAP